MEEDEGRGSNEQEQHHQEVPVIIIIRKEDILEHLSVFVVAKEERQLSAVLVLVCAIRLARRRSHMHNIGRSVNTRGLFSRIRDPAQ